MHVLEFREFGTEGTARKPVGAAALRDAIHEIEQFTEHFWQDHPLGRPILGTKETVESLTSEGLRRYFTAAYSAPNLIVAAVGNVEHGRVRELVERFFQGLPAVNEPIVDRPPRVIPHILIRNKELEQSHVCMGTSGYQQDHADRYASYVLNTILGGSMSSRLFQNVREKRGLAYAVFSSLSAYHDIGALSVYAGCGNDAVSELVDVVVAEIRRLKHEPVPADAGLGQAAPRNGGLDGRVEHGPSADGRPKCRTPAHRDPCAG